jgi:hypothetical protein
MSWCDATLETNIQGSVGWENEGAAFPLQLCDRRDIFQCDFFEEAVSFLTFPWVFQGLEGLRRRSDAVVQQGCQVVLVGPKSGIVQKPVKNYSLELTTRNDDPNKIHEKVVKPKVVSFGSAIGESLVVMIEHACRVV